MIGLSSIHQGTGWWLGITEHGSAATRKTSKKISWRVFIFASSARSAVRVFRSFYLEWPRIEDPGSSILFVAHWSFFLCSFHLLSVCCLHWFSEFKCIASSSIVAPTSIQQLISFFGSCTKLSTVTSSIANRRGYFKNHDCHAFRTVHNYRCHTCNIWISRWILTFKRCL